MSRPDSSRARRPRASPPKHDRAFGTNNVVVFRRPIASDAFAAASACFNEGRRIDMQRIAEDLGISRVTLYRWVGSRERLITEVLWARTQERFDLYESVEVEGARSAFCLVSFVRDVNCHVGMRQFLQDEPNFALQLLTSASSEYQKRYVALITDLIVRDRFAGIVSSEIPVEDLAYTAARVTQSYIHTYALIGQEPDPRRAESVLRVLLR